MRMSQLFSSTLHQAPADVNVASHQFLLRGGYIKQLATGIYTYLPLALRSIRKIENIIREEITPMGGNEVLMPIIHSVQLLHEIGQPHVGEAEFGHFKDRSKHDFVLALTHDLIAGDLTRQIIQSYRQLPKLIYQFQTKWRDDPRPHAGLIWAREFITNDSYSLDINQAGLERQHHRLYQAYFNIFNRCDLDVLVAISDTGMMGGQIAHEFVVLSGIGEDTILLCDGCGYAANQQVATATKPSYPSSTLLPVEKVATPDCKTIEAVAQYLDVPTWQTAKAVFFIAQTEVSSETAGQFVFAVIRGDLDVNATKLAHLIGAINLRSALEEEIYAVGAVPGYASPLGLGDVLVVVDESVTSTPNLVSGANEPDYHYRNVNYGRDFTASILGDITAVKAGDKCSRCQKPLRAESAVEVGKSVMIGSWMSELMGITYQDQEGQQQPIFMGSYGINLGRLLAMIAEKHHDEFGLCLPISIAPYEVQLIALPGRNGHEVSDTAETIYHELETAGIEVLYDDRPESPGVMFSDADLIGLPVRLTVSRRSLKNGGVELKQRATGELVIIPLEELKTHMIDMLAEMKLALRYRVVPDEYRP